MPGALVPALCSFHTDPSTKLIVSALRMTPGGPVTQSSWPVGVPDGHDAVAVDGRPAEHVVEEREDVREGVGRAVVGEVAASSTTGARWPSGSTPAADERSHDSATSERTPGGPARARTGSDPRGRAGRVVASPELTGSVHVAGPGGATPCPRSSR